MAFILHCEPNSMQKKKNSDTVWFYMLPQSQKWLQNPHLQAENLFLDLILGQRNDT